MRYGSMFDFSRVQRECFWDTSMNEKILYDIVGSPDMKKKQYIFEKILLNSTKILIDLSIFNKKELKDLTDNIKIPNFNKAHILRRKNLVEVYFFDKELQIDELKWVA